MTLPAQFTRFDGTGRDPRQTQIDVLKWLDDNWGEKCLAIQAPTGTGKSAIAKALQVATRGHIIVPSNQLLDQNQATYPDTNFLKGKEHYQCAKHEANCRDVTEVAKACPECPYKKCKESAQNGDPTIFNPISKYYVKDLPDADTIIVDEAHKLLELLELLVSDEFSYKIYKYPPNMVLADFPKWCKTQAEQYMQLAKSHENARDDKRTLRARMRGLKLHQLAHDVEAEPEAYALYEETRKEARGGGAVDYLVLKPVTLPRYVLKKVLGNPSRIVLLSATLPQYKAQEIFGREPFVYLDVPSPIPAKNRPVKMGYKDFNSATNPALIASWITNRMAENPGKATMVHVTYAMGHALHKLLPHALFHRDAKEKDATLKRFKEVGGLWLAAGCSEGVDLPFDECRLNLIPVIPYANMGDPVVKARKEKYGFTWYERCALITLVQQVGRSTRDPADESLTIIGDKRAVQLLKKYRKELSPSFWSAIVWQ